MNTADWLRLLQSPWLERLGWTLLHFLWQGALVALVLAAVLAGMRRRSAQIRYGVSVGGAVVASLLPLATLLLMPASTATPPPEVRSGVSSPASPGGRPAGAPLCPACRAFGRRTPAVTSGQPT